MQYSIHRCLAEIKLLDSKIEKATSDNVRFIGYKKNSSKGEYNTHMSDEDFANNVKSNYDSVIALINRRKEIKEAVTNSNAVTKVTIANKSYTVAGAIERKNSIEFEKDLLYEFKSQYSEALKIVTSKNDTMEAKLDLQITQMIGGDNSAKNTDSINNFSKMYREQNGWNICDPLGLYEKIEALEKEIESFESEVDYILSTSNAITMVEISD